VKRWEVVLLHASTLVVGLSGVVYGVMKYFLTGADPDSPLGHPWQPGVLKAHVLAAPVIVFVLGLVVRGHALPKLRAGEPTGRRTGLALLAFLAPLVLSGYAVQVLTGDLARKGTGWGHAAAGLVFLAAYGAHLLKKVPASG
jgi:membrane associated rhomboid family serine protease